MKLCWAALGCLLLGFSGCSPTLDIECIHWVDSLTGKAQKHPQCERARPSRNSPIQ
ncbi:MAG: hypothetical protein ACO4AU_00765 [bacterium]